MVPSPPNFGATVLSNKVLVLRVSVFVLGIEDDVLLRQIGFPKVLDVFVRLEDWPLKLWILIVKVAS